MLCGQKDSEQRASSWVDAFLLDKEGELHESREPSMSFSIDMKLPHPLCLHCCMYIFIFLLVWGIYTVYIAPLYIFIYG